MSEDRRIKSRRSAVRTRRTGERRGATKPDSDWLKPDILPFVVGSTIVRHDRRRWSRRGGTVVVSRTNLDRRRGYR